MTRHATIWVSALTLLAVSAAGCVGELTGPASGKGTVFFCVQDDPTVNFSGVFVNFGNIQINQNTSGNNTINDNDTTGDETGTDSPTDTMTSVATNDTSAATTSQAPATETAATTQQTVAQTEPAEGSAVTTISVDDIDCGRVEAEGDFGGMFRGQAGGGMPDDNGTDDCAPENPGCIADTQRGRADAECDRDQGFGNDDKCETSEVEVEADDVDVLQFKDRKAAFLGQGELEPGTVQSMCVTVEDVRVVTNDGQEIDVDIENGDICIDGPVEIREGQATLVVFKVDVDQSFASSTADRIVFNPTIVVKAAAPVTTTITIEETVTQTSVAGNETASPTMTTVSDNATASPNATTASPTMTTSTTYATTTASPEPTTTTGP